MRMPRELKEKWIEALRSGKYKQGVGGLKYGDQYCCLGVLQELREAKSTLRYGDITMFNDYSATLDPKTAKELDCAALGFVVDSADRARYVPAVGELLVPCYIAYINDAEIPFSEIAYLVEKYVEVCDEPTAK